jgi:hypothetical protein
MNKNRTGSAIDSVDLLFLSLTPLHRPVDPEGMPRKILFR